MFHLIPTTLNIDFLKISRPFVWASTAFVALSIVLLFTMGLNYGIDFTGGAEVQVEVPKDWDTGRLRETLIKGGIEEPSVIRIEDSGRNEFLVKTQVKDETHANVGEQIEKALGASLKAGEFQMQKVDVVGPQAGAELRYSAIISVLMAALGILIYITFRFDFRFAPGIVRALLFDVISTVGVWMLLRREFNLSTVAALLTIAGYSCNDTIVIYDRIRDFTKSHKNMSIYDIVNRSINLNLGRTVLTVLCTNFVVVSLWLLGGPVLGDFALCMLIGFTISVPSTIFVANPMVMYMEERIHKKEAKAAAKGGNPKSLDERRA
ncbi:MAG: protein translocase subunit SecF [Proteobacteria bacterium]|nr:MAG: protein translocase subunit SecF [Pseudomonadota bacterium]